MSLITVNVSRILQLNSYQDTLINALVSLKTIDQKKKKKKLQKQLWEGLKRNQSLLVLSGLLILVFISEKFVFLLVSYDTISCFLTACPSELLSIVIAGLAVMAVEDLLALLYMYTSCKQHLIFCIDFIYFRFHNYIVKSNY